jgi:hypothetical protein
MVWEGKDAVKTGRVILGATNPLASAPGTSASSSCLLPSSILSNPWFLLQSVATSPSMSDATSATVPMPSSREFCLCVADEAKEGS